jgi:NAD(P)-dependent dehydrogenase (short-subunit alcohol dehydrogenase family)
MEERPAALVTGASRGIGRGIAVALGRLGWSVVINYCQNAEAAVETQRLLEEAGGRGVIVQADVADRDDREKLVQATLSACGRIDLLVNNAGVAPTQRLDLLEATEESYDRVLDINLKGPYFLTQRVARVMIELLRAGTISRPKIINVGSVSAYASSPARGEYCLSKAAMGMMTALFADRLAEYGINVYEVRPGIIATDMTGPVQEKYDQLIADGLTPIRRWGQPEDVAQAVVAIVQDLLPFSTGEVINVDGGFHLRRL